jgi:hypothetical protein
MSLAIGKRQSIKLVTFAFGDGQHGGRVETSAEENYRAFGSILQDL